MHPLRKLLTFLVALVVLMIVDAAFVYRSIPSSAHRSYPETLFDAVEHPSRSMAARIHLLATRGSFHRRSRVLPQTADLWLSLDALSATFGLALFDKMSRYM